MFIGKSVYQNVILLNVVAPKQYINPDDYKVVTSLYL